MSTVVLLVRETEISWQKLLMASGGYPRRRIAMRVGMRGSSHPRMVPSLTMASRRRLLIIVLDRLRRANSHT